jgi:hypothetical protein
MENKLIGPLILSWVITFIVSMWAVSVCFSITHSACISQPPIPRELGEERQSPKNGTNGYHSVSYNFSSSVRGFTEGEHATDHAQGEAQDKSSKWNDPITWFTGGLVIVGFFQYLLMRSSHSAVGMIERAEIQLTDLNLPPFNRLETKAKIQVGYKNFGKTTANEVIANIRFPEMKSANLATTPAIIASGASNFCTFEIDSINGTISEADLGRFNSGEKAFGVVVEISFTDIFDKRITTIYFAEWDKDIRAFKHTAIKRK